MFTGSQDAVNECNERIGEQDENVAKLEAWAVKAREKILKLKAELSAKPEEQEVPTPEPPKPKPKKPVPKKPVPPVVQPEEEEEPQEVPEPDKVSPARPKPKSAFKGKKPDLGEGPSKPKGKQKAAQEEEEDGSDVQEVPSPPKAKPVKEPTAEKPKRGKPAKKAAGGDSGTEAEPKPKPKRGKKKDADRESDIEMVVDNGKGKGKAVYTEEVVAEKPKKRARPKASEPEEAAPPTKKKAAGRLASQPSISVLHGADDSDEGEAKAKKKRKIRIMPSQSTTFNWLTNGTDVSHSLNHLAAVRLLTCCFVAGDRRVVNTYRFESCEGRRAGTSTIYILEVRIFGVQMIHTLMLVWIWNCTHISDLGNTGLSCITLISRIDIPWAVFCILRGAPDVL